MDREHLDILMNQELDGANSPAESRRLAEELAADPGARRRFAELRETIGIFTRIETLQPPPGLRARILAAVRPVAPEPRTPRASRARVFLRELLGPVRRPALAGTFALGLVAGLLLYAAVGGLPGREIPGDGLLSGMAGPDLDTLSLASGSARVLDQGPVHGRARLVELAAGFVLDLDLATEPGHEVRVTFGPGLTCTGFTSPGRAARNLRVSGGEVSFLAAPAGRYVLELGRTGQPLSTIVLQIHHEGELVAEHTFATGSARREGNY